MLLGFDQFDFIRLLRQHRQMVLYCTMLKQAQTAEREIIEKEMAQVPQLAAILAQLKETDTADFIGVSLEALSRRFSRPRRNARNARVPRRRAGRRKQVANWTTQALPFPLPVQPARGSNSVKCWIWTISRSIKAVIS